MAAHAPSSNDALSEDELIGLRSGNDASSESDRRLGPPDDLAKVSRPWSVAGSVCAIVSIVVVFIALLSSVFRDKVEAEGDTDSSQVIKSPTDKRSFRSVTLQNGLQVLLISDPETDKAACAVDIATGSWRDPAGFEGLAHLLEHMLFLGSEKYPEESGYRQWLGDHGGDSNAYTDAEHTNYYFSVEWSALPGALDRFAQFFVSPLLDGNMVGREMRAVHSEHQKNLLSDGWRLFQLLKQVSRPGTPFSRFSTGDLTTLNRTGVMDALRQFHSLHYVAPNMRAVLVGRHPLDGLEVLAREALGGVRGGHRRVQGGGAAGGAAAGAQGVLLQAGASAVPVNGQTAGTATDHGAASTSEGRRTQGVPGLPAGQTKAGASVYVGHDYEPRDISPTEVFPPTSTLGRVVRVAPIAESHTISIVWPLPSQLYRYRRNPAGYVSSLLGDEGSGSILSYLKGELGLVEEVSAGLQLDSSGFSLMGVDMTLSPTAMRVSPQEQEEVMQKCLTAVFAYCNMLRRLSAPPKWVWDEAVQVAEATFQYYVKGLPADIASSMARSLHTVPPADILSPPERRLFDPVGIAHVLQSMTPDRMLVTLVSSAINATALTLEEPIYKTKYAESKVPAETLSQLASTAPMEQLHLPERNPFVPTRLDPLPMEDGNATGAAAAMDPDEAFVEAPSVIEPESIELALRTERQAKDEAAAAQPAADSPTAAQALARFSSLNRHLGGTSSASLSPSAMEVWYKQDAVFRRPEQVVYAKISSKYVAKYATYSGFTSLMLDAVKDSLQTVAYQGAKAGYGYSVSQDAQASALVLTFHGFTEHMPLWIDTVLDGILHPEVHTARAAMNMQSQLIAIENAEKAQQVYSRASYYSRLATGSSKFSIPERRSSANKMAAHSSSTLKRKLLEHISSLFAEVRLQLLVYGDVNAASAAETAGIFAKALKNSAPLLPEAARAMYSRPHTLSAGLWAVQRKVKREDENDSAAMVVADLGTRLHDCREANDEKRDSRVLDGTAESRSGESSGTSAAAALAGEDAEVSNSAGGSSGDGGASVAQTRAQTEDQPAVVLPAEALISQTTQRHAKGSRHRREVAAVLQDQGASLLQSSATRAVSEGRADGVDAAAVLADPTGATVVDLDPEYTTEWEELQAAHHRRRQAACVRAGGSSAACERLSRQHSWSRRMAVPSGASAAVRKCLARRSIAVSLLGDAVETPAFETLRTQQQLGYIVFGGTQSAAAPKGGTGPIDPEMRMKGGAVAAGLLTLSPVERAARPAVAPGSFMTGRGLGLAASSSSSLTDARDLLYVIAQGGKGAALMDARIYSFLQEVVPRELEALGDVLPRPAGGIGGGRNSTRWEALLVALDAEYRKKPQRMEEAASWMWSEISSMRYDFSAAEERLAQLRAGGVTLADLRALYATRVLGEGGDDGKLSWPRRLSVQVFGENDVVETTATAWKKDSFFEGKDAPAAVKEMRYVVDTSKLGQLLA